MTRSRILVLGISFGLIAILAAPAGAQDGPTITVEPTNVEAAGEFEFTVTGAGWTASPPIFVLPCTATNVEDLTATGSDTCDTAALVPATPVDGAFEVVVTYEVPEEGMCVGAGDAASVEAAGACITVGAASEETPAEDTDAEEDAAPDEELANTGVESGLIAIIAVSLLGAGAMAVGYTRKFA